MNSEDKLKELVDYIAVMTDYYMNVLSEEKTDYKRAYIKGKLNALSDIRKKLKKLIKNNAHFEKVMLLQLSCQVSSTRKTARNGS